MLFIENYCCFSIAGIIRPETDIISLDASQSDVVKEPDFVSLIPAMQLRRMSKPIKWGVSAVKLMQAGTWNGIISGISVGTAYGLLQDSETFLNNMITQNEQMLNPTAFIQSTHNTVAGQMALALQCNAHNMTFVHKGHSFEQALLDITLSITDKIVPEYFILGGLDECTPNAQKVIGTFQTDVEPVGEGASFLLVSSMRTEYTKASLVLHEMIYLKGEDEALGWIVGEMDILALNKDSNVLLLNGSQLSNLKDMLNIPTLNECKYKSILGSYPTVSAAALTLGVQQLSSVYDTVVIVNQYHNYWSLYVLER